MSASTQVRQSTLRQRQNHYIHSCFVKNDYRECLKTIESQLHICNGQSEYPLYIKGLIMRQQGRIEESLTIFQAALCLNPVNINNIKQVGQSLYLLGKHKEALGVFEEAERINSEDRMIWHSKGMCYRFLKQKAMAIECFETANGIQKHERTFHEIGELYRNNGDIDQALNTCLDALDAFPESTHFLILAGLLHLQQNNPTEAFQRLGNALTYDPKDPVAILAAGSIIQKNADHDVALSKYRVAMSNTPHSAELWNNIGMCFFGKNKLIGAASCLKRAIYLSPFDGKIHYNLGVVHLSLEQYASAFHYFSAAINLQKVPNISPTLNDARCYTYLGVTLSRLHDFENSFSAYDKSIELLREDATTRLNYAISLLKCTSDVATEKESVVAAGEGVLTTSAALQRAKEQIVIYDRIIAEKQGKMLYHSSDDANEEDDGELLEQRAMLGQILQM